jgi:hypothetical protein
MMQLSTFTCLPAATQNLGLFCYNSSEGTETHCCILKIGKTNEKSYKPKKSIKQGWHIHSIPISSKSTPKISGLVKIKKYGHASYF